MERGCHHLRFFPRMFESHFSHSPATARTNGGPDLIRLQRSRGVARVALFMIACAVALAAVGPVTRELPAQWSPAAVGALAGLAALTLSLLFTRWEGTSLKNIGVAVVSGSSLRLAVGFLIGLILVGLHASIMAVAGHVRWVPSTAGHFAAIPVTLLTYLLLSCREELAFHGYPLRQLNHLFGPYAALLGIGLIFAVEHVIGGYSWVNALLGSAMGSVLFGMSALATRGLAVPIGLHAGWNFGQWVIGEKETPGLWTVVTEDRFRESAQRVGMIGYLILVGLTTFAFWRWYQQKPS